WPDYLHLAFWADNITIRRSIGGYAPFTLMFGRNCVLPVEMEILSWYPLEWKYPLNRKKLLELRIKQLAKLPEDIERAKAKISASESRSKNMKWFNEKKYIRKYPFIEGDLVLIFEECFETIDVGRKFKNRYRGPYMVTKHNGNWSYKLKELDGTELSKSVHGNRLMPF
ncbi:hypothetical protein ROZALSC1DRAFT_6845, partial [Rozella allomycis CSF55]